MKTSNFLIFSIVVITMILGISSIENVFAATYTITDDSVGGACTSIGTWDDPTKTCTLVVDPPVGDKITINGNGITLDGSGLELRGPDNVGVSISGSGNTVRNLVISNFETGISIGNQADSISILDNTISGTGHNSGRGIFVFNGDGHHIISENSIDSFRTGIDIQGADFNIIDSNEVLLTTYGIEITTGNIGIDPDSNIVSNNIIIPTSIETVTTGITIMSGDQSTNNIVVNNNIFGGGAQFEIGIELSSSADVHNNIISGHSFIGARELPSLTGPISLLNNIFYDNPGGHYSTSSGVLNTAAGINALSYASNNLDGNPSIINPIPGGDFHLQTGSIAIDAGTMANAPSEDFEGDVRPQDSGIDIGADEFVLAAVDDPPVIVLAGANPQSILLNEAYVELGITSATDTEDGDVSANVIIDASAVDTSTLGSYPVSYSVTDSSSNTTVEIRTVDVVSIISQSGQATGFVNIEAPTCGIDFVSGNSINYGSLTPGQESSLQQLILDNTGDTFATLFVRGGDWLDDTSTAQMLVSDSHYDLTGTTQYDSMTPLSSDDTVVLQDTFDPNNDLTMFWQLVANIIGAFQGSLTQTVDFTVSC